MTDAIFEAQCEYQVCMNLHLGDRCPKPKSEGFGFTCEKNDDDCISEPGFEGLSTKVENVGDGYTYCQTVPVGGVAEFLLHDAGAFFEGGCGAATSFFQDSMLATCGTSTDKGCSDHDLSQGRDCVWRVPVPADCNHVGGGGGDPHIKRWNRKRDSFHGECDLVLLHSDGFHGGRGFDLHIRTTIQDWYSYVETAALRVGGYVMEMQKDKFFLNGWEHSDADLPMEFGGKFKYRINAPEIDTVTKFSGAKIYRVDLHNDSHVLFKVFKNLITVSVSGHENDFGDSQGLMGNFYNGEMYNRDGSLAAEGFDTYGLEWQVKAQDPKLFRTLREPQLPHEQCRFPSQSAQSARGRRLRSASRRLRAQAEEACAHKDEQDIDLCIMDVLAVGDPGVAAAW